MSHGNPPPQTGAVSFPQMPKTPNWVSVLLLVALFGVIQFTVGIDALPWWGWVLIFVVVAVVQLALESVAESWLTKRWQRNNPRWATASITASELSGGDWVRLEIDGRSLDWACRVADVQGDGGERQLVMGCGHSTRQHPEIIVIPAQTTVEAFRAPLS